jgi:hypothetical protein
MANDPLGNQFVASGLTAPYFEATRQGGHWNVMGAAGTPLVVIPTTLCITEIWNNVAYNQTLVITDLLGFHLLGTPVLHNPSIWATVMPPHAAPTLAAYAVGSQSGRYGYTTTATTRVVTAAGTTTVAQGWRPWGPPWGVISTALPGEAWSVPVDGKLIIPPGASLALTVVDALATASSVQVGAAWLEIPAVVNVG